MQYSVAIFLMPTFCVGSLSLAAAEYKTGVAALNKGEYSVAVEHLSVLAKANDLDSMYLMSELYRNGHGVKENAALAFKLASSAAEEGHPFAQYRLGRMYLDGKAFPTNLVEAAKWFVLSGANEQWDTSKARLANHYLHKVQLDDQFVAPQSAIRVGGFVSSPSGRMGALEYRGSVMDRLSPSERQRVNQIVKQWWQNHPNLHTNIPCPLLAGCK